MEVVIVILAAWIAILYLEAVYWIVRIALRWVPMIAAGVGSSWLAQRSGFEILEALSVGVIVCVLARCFVGPNFESEHS